MFSKLFRLKNSQQIHQSIQFIALITLGVGLPFSKIPLTLATILLVVNVILLWDWKLVFTKWFTNKVLVIFLVLVFFELISLVWSDNLNYGLDDLRKKLPLYSIPLCVLIVPISKNQWKWISYGFLISLCITASLNCAFYFQWIGYKKSLNFRELSMFVSHIRYALLVVLGIFLSSYLMISRQLALIIGIPLISFLLVYTFLSQVLAGYLAFSAVLLFLAFYYINGINNVVKRRFSYALLFFGLNLILIGVYYLLQPIAHKETFKAVQEKTKMGNEYNFMDPPYWENGYPVLSYMCEKELEPSWNKRSTIKYFEKDNTGEQVRFTLWRFLTSKGLRKDAESLAKLTQKEVEAIENGVSSCELMKGGLQARLYQLKNDYDPYNPNGKSGAERMIHAKIAWKIITRFPFFGIGAGDIEDEFKHQFSQNDYQLRPEFQHRTHNQFLTFWITSGIVTLASFLVVLFLGFYLSLKFKIAFLGCFTMIILTSCLSEDTLETQVGGTLAAVLIAILALVWDQKMNNQISVLT
jgi:hypothetical protein